MSTENNSSLSSLSSLVDLLIVITVSDKLDSLAEIVNRMNSVNTLVYNRLAFLESIVGSLRNEALYVATQPAYVNDVPASLS